MKMNVWGFGISTLKARQGLQTLALLSKCGVKIAVLHVQSTDNTDDRRIALTLEGRQRKHGKRIRKGKGWMIKHVLFPISTPHARINLLAYLRWYYQETSGLHEPSLLFWGAVYSCHPETKALHGHLWDFCGQERFAKAEGAFTRQLFQPKIRNRNTDRDCSGYLQVSKVYI